VRKPASKKAAASKHVASPRSMRGTARSNEAKGHPQRKQGLSPNKVLSLFLKSSLFAVVQHAPAEINIDSESDSDTEDSPDDVDTSTRQADYTNSGEEDQGDSGNHEQLEGENSDSEQLENEDEGESGGGQDDFQDLGSDAALAMFEREVRTDIGPSAVG
jgi:hypothetical protein